MVFFFILILINWVMPPVLSLYVLRDGDRILGSRRILLAIILTFLFSWIVWVRRAGPFGPLSQILVLTRRTVSYQTLMTWPGFTVFCLLFGIIIGVVLRCINLRSRKIRFRYSSVTRRCNNTVLLAVSLAVIPLVLCYWTAASGTEKLSLQEICRRERVGGEKRAYVIIRNDGDMPNELFGSFLSADDESLERFSLPRKVIVPGESLRVDSDEAKFLSVSESGGDTIRLLSRNARELDSIELPKLPADMAYRLNNGEWSVVRIRDSAEAATLEAPHFSTEGGFYDEPFDLTLTAQPGLKIYYTLDGSRPDEEGMEYSKAIRVYDRSPEPNQFRSIRNVQKLYLEKKEIGTVPVNKAFVVRAVAIDAEGNHSEIATQTFFVGNHQYADDMVVSLVADPEDLFGDDGIYVTGTEYDTWYERYREAEEKGETFEEEAPAANYEQRGIETERVANLELFDHGSVLIDQPVGIRIQGNTSREDALKRFSVHSRAAYGTTGLFEAEIFSGKRTHAFVLRDGLDNVISHASAEGRDVASLRAKPATVFLNGEFWYHTFLMERFNGHYFEQTFGVYEDNVELITVGMWSKATEEEKQIYDSLIQAAEERNMADSEAYDSFCELADVQSFIDYACINVYLGNADSHEHLNTCIWRTKVHENSNPYGDCRWRWALNDMDLRRKANRVNGEATDAEINSFSAARNESWPPLLRGGKLFEGLKKSPAFCRQFVLTFMDLVNSSFSEDHMTQLLAEYGETIDHYDDGFFRDRAGYITRYMAEEFGLTGSQEVLTIHVADPEAGTIKLNTIEPDLSSGSWTGSYYTDYAVTLSAIPEPGHRFDHWEVNGDTINGESIEVTLLKGGTTVNAIFQ